MSEMGALQMGHLSPCAFSSSPQCIQTHMCPHRYTTELILASEQMTQFPELTTFCTPAKKRVYRTLYKVTNRAIYYYYTCVYRCYRDTGRGEHTDDSAAATSCLMALWISNWRSKLVLINCFSSCISDLASLNSCCISDIAALDGTSGSNPLN